MKWSLTVVAALAVLVSTNVVRAQTGAIAGKVTDGSDLGALAPLPDVTVDLSSADGNRSATTDVHGHYEFTGLQSGRYTVEFSSRGVGDEERLVDLAPDSQRRVDVCMAPRDITGAALSTAARITGVVRDARTCETLADVRVEVRRQGGSDGSAPVASTATSGNGIYEFNQLDQENYVVTFSAEDYEEIRRSVEVRLGAAQPLYAYMPPRFRLMEERDEFGITAKPTTEFPWIPPVSPVCRPVEDCPEPLPPGRSPNPHPRVGITFNNGSEGGNRPPRPPDQTPPVTIWSNRPPR